MGRFFARWVFGRTGGMRVPLLSWPLALLIVVALHVGSVVLLDDLTFNNSAETYYPKDAPAVLLRDRLRQDFPSDEVLTVLFHGDKLFGRDFLERLHRLALKLEGEPLVDRVITVTTMERVSGSSDGFAVERLVDVRKLGDSTPEKLKQRVLADRFAPGALVSRDGQYMAMMVRPKPLSESAQRLQLTLAVAKAVNEAGLRPYYAGEAGPVTMDVAQLQSILSDSARFVPITVAIALVLLWWVVGRLRPVVIAGVAISTVVLPTLAAVAASGQPYTMASAILPSLLSAYTVVTLLHLYAGVQRAQRQSADRARVVDLAVLETIKPGIFNVLTTSAGLLSLVFVPIPPIQLFGVVGALGTVVVFVTVYALVPPFLRAWDGKPWPQRGSGLGVLGRMARRITMLSMRWPKTVLLLFVGFIAGFAQFAARVHVETDMLAFFPPQHAINVSTRLVESTLVGVTTLEVSLQAGKRDAFQGLETLRQIKQFQAWLETLPEVDRTTSMVDVVEEMNWAMNRERPAYRALPASERLLKQYLLVYDGNDLYELVNRDFSHARVLLNLKVHGTHATALVIDKIRARAKAEPLSGVLVDVGGYGRLLSDQIDLLVSGQEGSFAGAFIQIYLMMLLLWRTPVGAALCMVPNLAPLFFTFVLMGWAGIALDSSTVMIASVVLGITVDDTIHLYHGVRHRLRAGLTPVFAIARSFDASGRAVMATAAILIGQFGLLTASEFVPTSNFGLMTAVALTSGLAFELLLLPALLLLWHGRHLRPPVRPVAARRRTPPGMPRGVRGAVPVAPSSPRVGQASSAPHVLVCYGEDCKDAGAQVLWRHLRREEKRQIAQHPASALRLTKTSCLGQCAFAPVVQVYPEGVIYGPLQGDKLTRVLHEHLRQGEPVAELAISTPPDYPSGGQRS